MSAPFGRAQAAQFAAGQIDDRGVSSAARGVEQQAAAAEFRVVGVSGEDDQVNGRGVGEAHGLGFFELRGELAPLVFAGFDLLAALLHRLKRLGLLGEVAGKRLEHCLEG